VSTKEFGCFSCPGKAKAATDSCPECGHPINVSALLLSAKIGEYTPKRVLGRGFYGWTLLAEDELGQAFALKLIPAHRLATRPLHEARALVQCSQPPHPNIARFFRRFETTISLGAQQTPVVGLVFDHIGDAQPLREFLESKAAVVSRDDVINLAAGIAWGLVRLNSVQLWHNDLHDDNILVRRVSADEGAIHSYEAIIIDFGSAAPVVPDQLEESEQADFYYLGKHIFALVARFERDRARPTPTDRALASQLRTLAHRIMDPVISRRTHDPQEIARQISGAVKQSGAGHHRPSMAEMLAKRKVSLDRPLANSNALTLAPQDISLLFKDALGWEAQLLKDETVVVVGPRGCGKTMLLRYLSVASQAWPRRTEESPESVAKRLAAAPFVGFFVSCIDLRTPFLRSSFKHLLASDANAAHDFCREYFNLQVTLEAARSLEWLRQEDIAAITEAELASLSQVMLDLLNSGREAGSVGGAIDYAIERIDRRIADLSNLARDTRYDPTGFCRDDALLLVAKAIRTVPWAADKEIRFLVDDYSAAVLSPTVQVAINPILFHPSPHLRVKVSSEGDGPELGDSEGRKYKEGRELTKVNLGELYFQADEADGRLFIEAILAQRCEETRYGSLEHLKGLLGEHPEDSRFGDYIRTIAKRSRAGDAKFFGFGLLCRLCSGDVSYVIELLRGIVGDEWAALDSVPTEQQDAVIKRFARRQLQDLKRVNRYGPTLYQFATNIGTILRFYLLASKERPDERLRVEVEGGGTLSAEAYAIHQELLRHSVLVDGGFGKSRSGTTTRKFFVRRLLAPCFPFSPARRGSIAITIEQYDAWLRNPDTMRAPSSESAWESGLGRLTEE